MIDLDKELEADNLTQKDIMKFLLHSTQHAATREELQEVKKELKIEMLDMKTELKQDISGLRTELRNDMTSLKTELKKDIAKIDAKFDRIQWLIIATIASVLLKDYILDFLQK